MSKFRELVESVLKEFEYTLEEAKQVGLLYHATDLGGLKQIIKTNSLRSDWAQGISFSRNKNYWYGNVPFQLVLDGDKLSEQYKTQPHNNAYTGEDINTYKNTGKIEYETSVLGKGKHVEYDAGTNKDYFGTYGNDDIEDAEHVIYPLDKYLIRLEVNEYFNDKDNNINKGINAFKKAFPNVEIKLINKSNTEFNNWYQKQGRNKELDYLDMAFELIFNDYDTTTWLNMDPEIRSKIIDKYIEKIKNQ